MALSDQGKLQPLPVEIEGVASQIVDAGLKVHVTMGPGLLESAYEHCLAFELNRRGLKVGRQVSLPITYGDAKLDAGYRIDLLVEEAVIIEIKAIEQLGHIHQAQLLTYLRMSRYRLGFLMNFNVRLFKDGLKRFIR
jgi:GxxExxY protein